MYLKDFKVEFQRDSKVIITLSLDDPKELTKYIVKRERRLDEWL